MASSGESSMSGDESESRCPSDEPKGKMSEYEKQRLSRIAENRARLEALLGPSLNSTKRRGESDSSEEDDDDYRPDEADGDGDDGDEEFLGESSSVLPKIKKKKKKVVFSKKNLNRSDPLGDDDLNKAIALSLQHSEAGGSGTSLSKKRRNAQEPASWNKKKTDLMSKMQMTEDELVIYFYQFDEAGKGFITLRDVAKTAMVHDFTWTQDEVQNMIRCFDIDKDGKLSLDEFRKIVKRCRILKGS